MHIADESACSIRFGSIPSQGLVSTPQWQPSTLSKRPRGCQVYTAGQSAVRLRPSYCLRRGATWCQTDRSPALGKCLFKWSSTNWPQRVLLNGLTTIDALRKGWTIVAWRNFRTRYAACTQYKTLHTIHNEINYTQYCTLHKIHNTMRYI